MIFSKLFLIVFVFTILCFIALSIALYLRLLVQKSLSEALIYVCEKNREYYNNAIANIREDLYDIYDTLIKLENLDDPTNSSIHNNSLREILLPYIDKLDETYDDNDIHSDLEEFADELDKEEGL